MQNRVGTMGVTRAQALMKRADSKGIIQGLGPRGIYLRCWNLRTCILLILDFAFLVA